VRSRRFPRRSVKEMRLKGEEVTMTPCEGMRKRKCQRVSRDTATGRRSEKGKVAQGEGVDE
jgi:hypothetical protein